MAQKQSTFINRRAFLTCSASFAGLAMAGCQTIEATGPAIGTPEFYTLAYAPKPEELFPLPAIKHNNFKSQYLRQRVKLRTRHPRGTIIVDPYNRHLYLVESWGKALRYGVGVGKAGFAWAGTAKIQFKREWPTWTPPKEMIQRRPDLKKYEDGMEPSLKNPLGARALYIYQNGRDTLYRIHGTDKPQSIGTAASSGCIRMFNQDIIDLYNRVKPGAKLVVLQKGEEIA